MSGITVAVLIFSLLGAADKILGNRFGMGKEFEKGFALFCPMALTMLGMLVLAPGFGAWMVPVFEGFYRWSGIDPSMIPASLFANDMGGMTLARQVCKEATLGNYNAFVVSSMMGCVISYTIPFALGMVKPEQHHDLFLGLLCGIITIPVGCFAAGLMCGLTVGQTLVNLLPLLILAVLIGAGLIFVPRICIRAFSVFGQCMRVISIVGLCCACFTFLTGIVISEHFDTLENAAMVCVNACVTLSGALPLMYLVSRLLDRPLAKLGSRMGVDSVSALALLSTLVTNASTFGVMEKMNRKGVVLNSAFAVSAAFTFGGHLAFTMAFDQRYVAPMIVGKVISGLCALALAMVLYRGKGEA